MKPMKKTEKGQILVLLVLAIIGLLGVTALAIDGSMIYADRRFTQSVADSASLAGGNAIKEKFSEGILNEANFSCTSAVPAAKLGLVAAIGRSSDYYSEIVTPTIDTVGDPYETKIQGPHKFSVSCNLTNDSLIVNVELTSETSTAFIQVIDKFIARNTVHAETEVLANRTLTGPYGIIAVSDEFGNKRGGTHFSSNGGVNVLEGGTCSNSGIETSGTSTSVIVEGTNDYDENFPWDEDGNPIIDPDPTKIADSCIDTEPFLDLFAAIEAACDTLPTGVLVDDRPHYTLPTMVYQGKFDHGIQQHTRNESMIFAPGLYCLSDNQNALDIVGGSVIADGVTFVILSGDVKIGGNAANLLITAQDADPMIFKYPLDADGDLVVDSPTSVESGWCEKAGAPDKIVNVSGTCETGYFPKLVENKAKPPFLFYVKPWNGTGQRPILSLLGTSQSAFDGLIWAPDSLVAIGGTSSTVSAEFGTTIVGYDVSIKGNADVTITAITEGIPAVSGWLDFLN